MKKTYTILDTIIADKRKELVMLKEQRSLQDLKADCAHRQTGIRNFKAALHNERRISIIAEIKKASPSGGIIQQNFNHRKIAEEYSLSGLVDAISVITEKHHFHGDLSYIADIKSLTELPLLRKDFIFDEYQVYESYLAEADAILLISAMLEKNELAHLFTTAQELGLYCLIETHSETEVMEALSVGADIIGVNARDLHSFEMDETLFARLSPIIPDECIKVAESGLETATDVERIYQAGAHAALIGTSLMKAENKKLKLQQLLKI